ncbi:hypothetical protein C1H46_036550 [Malus baccata]|uniref:Uncharacterized protein n=1 Tax=Malus baccata TaxID=106549 RepID=A0A540KUJ5_MALBA|nr:hypothetical protein C1H46_036550 [Malus baccata]
MINGAKGLDRWEHVAFQHHNVDQSPSDHRPRAPIVLACDDDHPVKFLMTLGVVGEDVQMK